MEELKKELLSEIAGLREKGHKYYNGEMTLMDFKHASGGMGVYGQRGGKSFMIRLRIPSGVIKVNELNLIAKWAEKYNLEILHFTTRQAIQYHDMSIDDVCDLMTEALENDIFTRGSGGNFPRNVALSPLAGVDPKEPFDPTPYALSVGNYFMERITSYKLPRKLKVSFSNTEEDTAHCTIQDLGFLAVDNEKFRIYLGGGLGRNPRLALIYPEEINAEDVLYYVEGMVELFKHEGNYENRNKARVRYMVEKLGEEGFITEYKKYVDEAKSKGHLSLSIKPIECKKTGTEIKCTDNRLFKQRQSGLYSIYVHPVGGQIKVEKLKQIYNAIKDYSEIDIRLSMTEGIYFRNLNGYEAQELLKITEDIGGRTSFDYSVSCIGVPRCQMGIGNSQETLHELVAYVKENCSKLELLPRIYISGCGNSCGIHQIGAIGLTAKKKRINDVVEDAFEMFVNGSFKVHAARLGNSYGDILKKDLPTFVVDLYNNLEKLNMNFTEFIKNEERFNELFEKYKS